MKLKVDQVDDQRCPFEREMRPRKKKDHNILINIVADQKKGLIHYIK